MPKQMLNSTTGLLHILCLQQAQRLVAAMPWKGQLVTWIELSMACAGQQPSL